MHLELFIERAADIAFFLILEYDKCFWLDQAVIVLDGHDGGLEHFRMANQCVLDLERRYPNAADLEHIVRAAAEGVHAIRTPHVFVTGAGPLAHKRAARFLTLIPVAGRGRFAAHPKLADFIVSNILPSIVNQPEVVTVHRHAGCTVLHGIRKVGQKKMPYRSSRRRSRCRCQIFASRLCRHVPATARRPKNKAAIGGTCFPSCIRDRQAWRRKASAPRKTSSAGIRAASRTRSAASAAPDRAPRSRRPTSDTTLRRRGHRRRTASARKRSRRLHGCRCGAAPRCARCSSASNAHASFPSAFRSCRMNRASTRPHRHRFWPAPSLRSRPPIKCPAAAPTPGRRRPRQFP